MARISVVKSQMSYAGSSRVVFGLFDELAMKPHLAGTAFLLSFALAGGREASVRTYAYNLAGFLSRAESDPKIANWDNVTNENIEAYFVHVLLGERNLQGASLELARAVISAFYSWAFNKSWSRKERTVSFGAVEKLRIIEKIDNSYSKSLDKYRLHSQYICEDEYGSLISYVGSLGNFERQRDLLCLELAYLAGLRRSEVVNPSNLTVKRINKAINTANKTGQAGFYLSIAGKGRGGGKIRSIFIPPSLRESIERFINGALRTSGNNKSLFVSRRGECLGEHYPTNVFNKARKNLIISSSDFNMVSSFVESKRRCFHSLRHSYATNMAKYLRENDLPLTILQELLGHEDMETTKVYVHYEEILYKDNLAKISRG